jgi:hypothetical protein
MVRPEREMPSGSRSRRRYRQDRGAYAADGRAALRASWGREPSDAEVIGEHNARMRATRKDADRQGAMASIDDLRPLTTYAVDQRDDILDEPDFVLHPSEGRRLVKALLDAAAAGDDPEIRMAAQVWLSRYYAPGPSAGVLGTVSQLVAQIGCPQTHALDLISCLKGMGAAMLHEQFGIDGDAV